MLVSRAPLVGKHVLGVNANVVRLHHVLVKPPEHTAMLTVILVNAHHLFLPAHLGRLVIVLMVLASVDLAPRVLEMHKELFACPAPANVLQP